MNNLQPFEKHLADHLHQLPVPDREEGWKEMRKMLDRDLPEGGTAWSGNRKWWWMGITVAIIIAGLFMSEENRKKELASSRQNVAVDNSPKEKQIQSSTNIAKDNGVNNARHLANPIRTDEIKDPARAKNQSRNSIVVQQENSAPSNHSDILTPTNKKTNNKKGKSKAIEAGIATTSVNTSSKGSGSYNRQDVAEKNVLVKDDQESVRNEESTREFLAVNNIQSISIAQVLYEDPFNKLSSIPSSYEPLKAEPGKTDKEFQKQSRKQSIKADNRKMTARSMRGESREKDQDLTFAAGLALPQSFAIAGQQAPSYGVNASSSRVSDYLPVPFFQYHMNSRLFFQTELQFQSPQYTDRLLVYQDQQHVAQSNTMLEKNIYIEKLYYFHIPFNVYFSPAKNFYVGSGLQFSSLLSGVATYQNNRYDGSSLQNSYSKVEGFKDDSVASKLSSSEWRYQFDASYYVKRLTFGARYNQALSQFVNIQPSAGLPYTEGRNQSFLIYLRYNIWEERKK